MKKSKIYLRISVVLGLIGIILWNTRINESLAFFSAAAVFLVFADPKQLDERKSVLLFIAAVFISLMVLANGYYATGFLILALMAYTYFIDRPKTRMFIINMLKRDINDHKHRSGQ